MRVIVSREEHVSRAYRCHPADSPNQLSIHKNKSLTSLDDDDEGDGLCH